MFETRFRIMPQTFIVVGCGGTGSRLVPLLAQFIKTCAWVIDPVIFLVDADVVEQKNLARQNFVKSDVGKPKAEVLANRYGRAYDINIVPVLMMVKDTLQSRDAITTLLFSSKAMIRGNTRASIVISCVDTMQARVNILNCFNACWSGNGIFLDGGNEDLFGQVMISNPNKVLTDESNSTHTLQNRYSSISGMLPIKEELDYIPIDLKFYANTPDQGSTRSCADLDQTMAINSLVANTMFGIIQNIMYSKPIPFSRINITLNGSTPELMTAQSLWNMKLNREREIGSRINELNSCMKRFDTGLVNSIYDYLDFHSSVFIPLLDKLRRYKEEQEQKVRKEREELEAKVREAEELKVKERAAKIPPLTPVPPIPIPVGAIETTLQAAA